ncbi:hypothetical protein FLW16_04065 [Microbispora sp. KK1-11]|nr:hypothetical protein FLW16_04065 [Microbispora sp. KK1-11]
MAGDGRLLDGRRPARPSADLRRRCGSPGERRNPARGARGRPAGGAPLLRRGPPDVGGARGPGRDAVREQRVPGQPARSPAAAQP